jgi:hypothetical protein
LSVATFLVAVVAPDLFTFLTALLTFFIILGFTVRDITLASVVILLLIFFSSARVKTRIMASITTNNNNFAILV